MLRAFNTVCAAASIFISTVAIFGHLKNYRKVSDQRLIVRILVMVPLFSISAWLDLYGPSRILADIVTFIREWWEAFVIYTFYSLLTTLLGGEREIIFTATGRPPLAIPLVFGRKILVDISDPPTFLLIKRFILQFVWMRLFYSPLWFLLPSLGPLWVLTYNISMTLALNSLMIFWASLHQDLEPYRVVLKFLSVKLIVFFSYWQSLALAVIRRLGLIQDEAMLNTIKSTLMCIETVGIALLHYKAFPRTDYASTVPFGFARMRLVAAVRDFTGFADLVQDVRSTFLSGRNGYHVFDSVEAVLDHPESRSRQNRLAAGLRYKNGGRSKYWLPKSSLKGILKKGRKTSNALYGSVAATESASAMARGPPSPSPAFLSEEEYSRGLNMEDEWSEGEEQLYEQARRVYGDYNYPVITVRQSEEYVSFQDRLRRARILESV